MFSCAKLVEFPCILLYMNEASYFTLRRNHMRGSRKFSPGGGGGGVQIPRRGLTENFNMAKINNLAISGGGGGRTPCPPPRLLDLPMSQIPTQILCSSTCM